MSWKRWLGLTYGEAFWLGAAAALLVYELVVVLLRPEGLDVLTRAYRASAPRWTVWPVGVGILMGHLHGPTISPPRWTVAIFILLAGAALGRDLVVKEPISPMAIFGIFLVSVAIGASTWAGRP